MQKKCRKCVAESAGESAEKVWRNVEKVQKKCRPRHPCPEDRQRTLRPRYPGVESAGKTTKRLPNKPPTLTPRSGRCENESTKGAGAEGARPLCGRGRRPLLNFASPGPGCRGLHFFCTFYTFSTLFPHFLLHTRRHFFCTFSAFSASQESIEPSGHRTSQIYSNIF